MVRVPNTPIIVDEFKFIPGCFIYLLTHLHTDHTGGLTPSWNNGIIYCTEITKRMLLKKFQFQEPERVIALDIGPTYYIPLVPPSPFQHRQQDNNNEQQQNQIHSIDDNIWRDPTNWVKVMPNNKSTTNNNSSEHDMALSELNGTTYMQVNLIDANHCPGSCMYLMEGYFGTILHTGDFRYDPRILKSHCLQDKKIDHLYLDDTFLDPIYDFPSRQEAGQQVIEIVKSLPDNYLILIAVDTLGKEELLVALAMTFNTLIVVPEERIELIECMEGTVPVELFTHDPNLGRVLVKGKKEVNFNSIMYHRKTRPTVGIVPSGWSTSQLKDQNDNNREKIIYRVPYSLHSSYSELVEFVRHIHPKNIYSASKHDNISLRNELGRYCDISSPMKAINVPRSVLSHMERSSNIMDHKQVINVTSNTKTALGSTPRTSFPKKRKSFPPQKKKVAQIFSQPTQTLAPNKQQAPTLVDLTDSCSIGNNNGNTSIMTDFTTQDVLAQMFDENGNAPKTPLKTKSSFETNSAPPNISSFEALNLLNDLRDSQPNNSRANQTNMCCFSPKPSPNTSLFKTPPLLQRFNNTDKSFEDKSKEIEDEYELSLSPHSGDGGVDESEILNHIDLENSDEDTIIIKTPLRSFKKVGKKQPAVDCLVISDDDLENGVIVNDKKRKTPTSTNSNPEKKRKEKGTMETPLEISDIISPINTKKIATPNNTQDLLNLKFSMELTPNETGNAHPQGFSLFTDDLWKDEEITELPPLKEKKQEKPIPNIPVVTTASENQESISSSNKNTKKKVKKKKDNQDHLKKKTKLPFQFDLHGHSQSQSSSSPSPLFQIQDIFNSKPKLHNISAIIIEDDDPKQNFQDPSFLANTTITNQSDTNFFVGSSEDEDAKNKDLFNI